ncbi:hypothetical protein HDU67_005563 [Dinochytrium kinnereticum]|nr:hypothetical protein HDU67_005563 [Dinochytrium kinnereticum]
MQYHALSLSQNNFIVDLVGYSGSTPLKSLLENDNVTIHYLRPPKKISYRFAPLYLIAGVARVFSQVFELLWILLSIPQPNALLVQFNGSEKLNHHSYEQVIGHFAYAHLCVTEAMRMELKEKWGVRGKLVVVYDKPPSSFRRLEVHEIHAFLSRLTIELTSVLLSPEEVDAPSTIITERCSNGSTRFLKTRPAILVSSTSWTEDEDFSVLLDACAKYDIIASSAAKRLPPVILIITGRGPLQEMYMKGVKELNLKNCQILTAWLPIEDYPKLLGSCDLGISLHVSSSGLDLPMKIVDMLKELVKDGINGLTFVDSDQLCQHMISLLQDFPKAGGALDALRAGVEASVGDDWPSNWAESARKSCKKNGKGTKAGGDVTLWVCLACGAINCGRNDFQHAQAHNDADKAHSLVVNVDTLECWCYECDDYVVAGEKRNQVIAEAQAAVQKAKPIVKAPVPPTEKMDARRTGKPKPFGAAGLVNLGNTCFFNSVMQCMAYTNALYPIALAAPSASSTPGSPLTPRSKSVSLLTAANERTLTKAFLNFIRVMREQLALQKSTTVNPSILFGHLSNKYKVYKSFRQQDSHELLRCLLDAVKEEQVQRDGRGRPFMHQQTFVDKVFGGKLVSAIVCDTCKNVSYRFEDFLDLSVPIVGEERRSSAFSLFSAMKKRLSRSPSPAAPVDRTGRKLTANGIDTASSSGPSSKSPTPLTSNPSSVTFDQARFLESLLRPIDLAPSPAVDQNKLTVQKCIQAFTAVDVLEGANGLACEFCNGTIDPKANPNFRLFQPTPAMGGSGIVGGQGSGMINAVASAAASPISSPSLRPRLQIRSSSVSLPSMSSMSNGNPTHGAVMPYHVNGDGRPLSMASLSSSSAESSNEKTSFETSSFATDVGAGPSATSSTGASTLLDAALADREGGPDGVFEDPQDNPSDSSKKMLSHSSASVNVRLPRRVDADPISSSTLEYLTAPETTQDFYSHSRSTSATSSESIDRPKPMTSAAPAPSSQKGRKVLSTGFKRFLIHSFPEVLVVHLKRFQQVGSSGRTRKVEDLVAFKEVIDLEPFLSPEEVVELIRKGDLPESLFIEKMEEAGDGESLNGGLRDGDMPTPSVDEGARMNAAPDGGNESSLTSPSRPVPPRTISAAHLARTQPLSPDTPNGLDPSQSPPDSPPLPPRSSSISKFTIPTTSFRQPPSLSLPPASKSGDSDTTPVIRAPPRTEVPPPPPLSNGVVNGTEKAIPPAYPTSMTSPRLTPQKQHLRTTTVPSLSGPGEVVPPELAAEGWMALSTGDRSRTRFRLYGLVVHIGSIFGGHYVAYIRVPASSLPNGSGAAAMEPMMDITPPPPVAKMGLASIRHSKSRPSLAAFGFSGEGVGMTGETETRGGGGEGGSGGGEVKEDFWIYCSDTVVRMSSWEEVQKAQAYLLFYERQ